MTSSSDQPSAGTPAGQQPYVDALSLSGIDEYVYESIVTLENTGQPTTRATIAAVADLDDATLDKTLRSLTDRKLIVQTEAGGEPAYAPARRDWSASPGAGGGQLAG